MVGKKEEKRKVAPIVSPEGELTYAFFTEADTRFEEPTYKGNLILGDEESKPMRDQLSTMLAEFAEAEGKKAGNPPFEKQEDGRWMFKLKQKRDVDWAIEEGKSLAPQVLDVAGNRILGKKDKVGNGSIGSVEIQPRLTKSPQGCFVVLRPVRVRLTKFIPYIGDGGSAWSDEFASAAEPSEDANAPANPSDADIPF